MARAPADPHALAVDGTDDLPVTGTEHHQADLRMLAEARDGDGGPFRLRVVLRADAAGPRRVAVLGPHGGRLGELPDAVGAPIHAGLQLLASLAPPYVLGCDAVAWHVGDRPDGALRLTLQLDLEEVARLAG